MTKGELAPGIRGAAPPAASVRSMIRPSLTRPIACRTVDSERWLPAPMRSSADHSRLSDEDANLLTCDVVMVSSAGFEFGAGTWGASLNGRYLMAEVPLGHPAFQGSAATTLRDDDAGQAGRR